MSARSIAIIGAGIAGLSAGCYGQMNGYRTRIYELGDKPGGLCTSWVRQGYVFDGCIHWLVGSRPGTGMHRMWQELGAVQGRRFVDHDEFIRIEGAGGKCLVLYTDVDRLEQHLRGLSPQDSGLIAELTGALRLSARFDPPVDWPAGLAGLRMAGRMLPVVGLMRKYGRVSMQSFAARFRDAFLREALPVPFDLPDFPLLGALIILGGMHARNAGYPIGGSLEFARAIERRYLELGGEVHYRSRVERVLVEEDRAVGVRLEGGREERAGVVISAADGHSTLFDMLQGRSLTGRIRGYYEHLSVFPSMIQVSLGVARSFAGEPHMVSYRLEPAITVAGEPRQRLTVKHYCCDPTLAPAGKSVLVVGLHSGFGYWQALRHDPARYEAEKQGIARTVIGELERRFPGIGGQVEAVDVATPLTYERYTGNWQGSIQGWLVTTRTIGMVLGRGMEKTLPGLEGFYMVGQWVQPGGGVPTGAMTARSVMRMICRRDGKRFVTTLPA